MAIREAQLRNREKQNEVRGKPSKPRTTDHPNLVDIEPALYQVAVKVEPFKMQQFRNVKSRVKKEMEWSAKENNSMQQQRHRDDAGREHEEEDGGRRGQQADGQAKAGSPAKPFLRRGTLDIRKAQV